MNFLLRKWMWACEKPLVWANLFLLIGTGLVLAFPGDQLPTGPSDFRIRLWAMWLQLLGAWTVWHDLMGTAQQFGVGGIALSLWRWIKRGFGFNTYTTVSKDFPIRFRIQGHRPKIRVTAGPSATIEERMNILENHVRQLDADIDNTAEQISITEKDIRSDMRTVETELKAALGDTNKRFTTAFVGSYPVLLFGATWLFVGIVFSSIAPEIAKLVAS